MKIILAALFFLYGGDSLISQVIPKGTHGVISSEANASQSGSPVKLKPRTALSPAQTTSSGKTNNPPGISPSVGGQAKNGRSPASTPHPQVARFVKPSKGAVKNEGDVAVQLKWIDFWIALPGVIATVILGLIGRRKKDENGKPTSLGIILLSLASAVGIMILTLLGLAWILSQRALAYQPPAASSLESALMRSELPTAISHNLQVILHQQMEQLQRDNIQAVRSEVLPAVRKDMELRFPVSSFVTLREAAMLREQLRATQLENAKLWAVIEGSHSNAKGISEAPQLPYAVVGVVGGLALIILVILLGSRMWRRPEISHMLRREVKEMHDRLSRIEHRLRES